MAISVAMYTTASDTGIFHITNTVTVTAYLGEQLQLRQFLHLSSQREFHLVQHLHSAGMCVSISQLQFSYAMLRLSDLLLAVVNNYNPLTNTVVAN